MSAPAVSGAEFDRVMASPDEIDRLLAADRIEAARCRVRGTPSVFINGVRLKPRHLPDYRSRIDDILSGTNETKSARAPVCSTFAGWWSNCPGPAAGSAWSTP